VPHKQIRPKPNLGSFPLAASVPPDSAPEKANSTLGRTSAPPIAAASSGTVIDSGRATGYGLWVRIQHQGGIVTTYGHNNRNHVHTGQRVQAGQTIAEVGDRGESTGPHLHFQVDTIRILAGPPCLQQRSTWELLAQRSIAAVNISPVVPPAA
jgi:murein DD-endopeptidase MepM/ murein hydrolase activator NlpD